MGSQEEKMKGVEDDFPYTALYVELDKYTDRFVPWHWHKTVELFYMESGQLEYYTSRHKIVFPKGSGAWSTAMFFMPQKTNRAGKRICS